MTADLTRRGLLAAGAAVALSGCSSKFRRYDGPQVTRVVVAKEPRQMFLLHHGTVLRSYPVSLGFAPKGHKRMRGDGRTPEGRYIVDRRNPKSQFHLSVGISYPDAEDIARARARGSIRAATSSSMVRRTDSAGHRVATGRPVHRGQEPRDRGNLFDGRHWHRGRHPGLAGTVTDHQRDANGP